MSWKSLFIKEEEKPDEPALSSQNKTVFPSTFSMPSAQSSQQQPSATYMPAMPSNDKEVLEVLSVYEKGLESINMPGYDFFEFYMSVNAVGAPTEPVYNMAFQMAKTMDRTISAQKLLNDAEFYISKINEVHSQYASQGQSKINDLDNQKQSEKQRLANDINNTTSEIEKLKSQLSVLENELQQKRAAQSQVEQMYKPQETAIRSKLSANDNAHNISLQKLNTVKDGISKYLQNK
ncbi:MAG: hypothetical protein INR73_26720 [Williamsia sp.]|nr:hypothetical protein [Williamsia sp.]